MNIDDLFKYKTSDTIFILGSGKSILNLKKEDYDLMRLHDTIGFNHWYVNGFKPTFYDLSYNYMDRVDYKVMYENAIKHDPDSVFLTNPTSTEVFKDKLKNVKHCTININHFDFEAKDKEELLEMDKDDLGLKAKYWSTEIFNYFGIKIGNLTPNEQFFYKTRSQLFIPIQFAWFLGYKKIVLVGVDLNNNKKFQDYVEGAPEESTSKEFATRETQDKTVLESGRHSSAVGRDGDDLMGIQDVIEIINKKYFKDEGIELFVHNSNPDSLLIENGIEKYKPKPIEMPKITFCIPSKSNLRYLKHCIKYIRNCSYRKDHDILVWVDEDKDGTTAWLEENKEKYNVKYFENKTGKLYGIAKAYDRLIYKAKTDIVMVYHADMILGHDADFEAWKYLKPKGFVCSTRIEPPLHPEGNEKIVKDFGMWPEQDVEDGFKEKEFYTAVDKFKGEYRNKFTKGMFAPWMVYKKDLISIGGHDFMFKSAREDSDIFNRMVLAGFNIVQSWSSLVYHLTCRAGQFQHATKTEDLKTKSTEWAELMNNSSKEFIRKWGTGVLNNTYLHPIVAPKYDIGFRVFNCNRQMLEILEPWCSNISVDYSNAEDYIRKENPNTEYELYKRVGQECELNNDVIVEFDASQLNQQKFQFIQNLPLILKDSGQIGKMKYDIFTFEIKSLNTYEHKNIVNKNNEFMVEKI